jgi:hypothetical protein
MFTGADFNKTRNPSMALAGWCKSAGYYLFEFDYSLI